MTVADMNTLLEEYGEEEEVSRAEKRLSPEETLLFFTGSFQPPVSGFHKPIEVMFSCQEGAPRVSTCFLTATFPLNYRGSRREYLLQGKGPRAGREACKAYTAWVFNSPGYGTV